MYDIQNFNNCPMIKNYDFPWYVLQNKNMKCFFPGFNYLGSIHSMFSLKEQLRHPLVERNCIPITILLIFEKSVIKTFYQSIEFSNKKELVLFYLIWAYLEEIIDFTSANYASCSLGWLNWIFQYIFSLHSCFYNKIFPFHGHGCIYF